MADTGEKVYLASETTAQEILNGLDNVASRDDIVSISNQLSGGINGTVKHGKGITTWIWGNAYSSTCSVSGEGVVYVLLEQSDASNGTSIEGDFKIDGTALERSSIKGYSYFQGEFFSSVYISGGNHMYIIGLRE